MSGGNIFVYEQLMEQKMMLQMLMMRQAAADAAGNQEKGSASRRAGRDRQNGAGANNLQNGTLPARRTKKTLPTPQTSTAAAACTLNKSEATPPCPENLHDLSRASGAAQLTRLMPRRTDFLSVKSARAAAA